MEKKLLAELVHESVTSGENLEDFSWMVNTLIHMERSPRFIRMRTGRHYRPPSTQDKETYLGRAWFLCLLVKPKPPEYMEAIREFRLAFAGVARDERLHTVFRASVRDRLLRASNIYLSHDLRPSLYFDIGKAQETAEQLGIGFRVPRRWY